MIYTAALLATLVASANAFTSPRTMRAGSARMAEEEPWFPGKHSHLNFLLYHTQLCILIIIINHNY